MHERLLIDTCALIWLANKSDSLSEVARLQIEEADEVFVSSVSAWERALKHSKGKLKLPCDPITWFDHALEVFGMKIMPFDHKLWMRSTQLPDYHKDPADRTIIQLALENDLTIVTHDSRFRQYGVKVIT